MANDDKKQELRQKLRFAAMEGLRPHDGLPVPPRVAMRQANRASKKLEYPVPPYAGTFLPVLLMDAKKEWDRLGRRWQRVVAPVVVLVGLITWEQEAKRREKFRVVVERRAAKTTVAELYGRRFLARPKKRKLFGVIPLPGRGK